MKNITLYIILIITISFQACSKFNLGHEVPNCIEDRLAKADRQGSPPYIALTEYIYKGEKVYYITTGCCDFFNELYDSNCNLICYPSGGFTGGGDGKCTDFYQLRTDEKILWEKE